MKKPTRALSIRQPSAEQILRGTKRIEYRSQTTRILNERVYIDASLKPRPGGEELPRGVLVGTVEISHCTGGPLEYRWHLRKPRRLTRQLKPQNQPQPVWFRPFGRTSSNG